MSYRKSPDQLEQYKPLYSDSRYWIFENDPLAPFDEWTGDYKILVYDRINEGVAACGNWNSDGTISAEITWGQGVDFVASDLKNMCVQICYLEKHYS